MNISRQVLRMAAYRLPFMGHVIRRSFEKIKGKRDYETQEYWDHSLHTWANTYLAGTIQIDTRNNITAILIRHMCANAKSILDIGCAGGSLAFCIDGCECYYGIDISTVAINEAIRMARDKGCGPEEIKYIVSDLRNFHIDEYFDAIVFNEVLYYLTLESAEREFARYSQYLTPGGVIVVSLKNDEISRMIIRSLCKRHQRIYGVIYQEQLKVPSWKITYTRERPAILVNVFRPVAETPD